MSGTFMAIDNMNLQLEEENNTVANITKEMQILAGGTSYGLNLISPYYQGLPSESVVVEMHQKSLDEILESSGNNKLDEWNILSSVNVPVIKKEALDVNNNKEHNVPSLVATNTEKGTPPQAANTSDSYIPPGTVNSSGVSSSWKTYNTDSNSSPEGTCNIDSSYPPQEASRGQSSSPSGAVNSTEQSMSTNATYNSEGITNYQKAKVQTAVNSEPVCAIKTEPISPSKVKIEPGWDHGSAAGNECGSNVEVRFIKTEMMNLNKATKAISAETPVSHYKQSLPHSEVLKHPVMPETYNEEKCTQRIEQAMQCDSNGAQKTFAAMNNSTHNTPNDRPSTSNAVEPATVSGIECAHSRESRLHPTLNNNSIKCYHCKTTFGLVLSLEQHIKTHGYDHVCTLCGMGFSHGGDSTHMESHVEQMRYQCNACGHISREIGDLMKHIKATPSHFVVATNQCYLCWMNFENVDHLNEHRRQIKFDGMCIVQCEYCNISFTNTDHLIQHMRFHLGVSAYQCRRCSQVFSSLTGLFLHLFRHKGKAPPQCDGCGIVCPFPYLLSEHIAKTHASIYPVI